MKKMKKSLITITVILITLGGLYLAFIDKLPPRTPQKLARVISHLPVPRNAKVITFEDVWVGLGNGYSHVEIELTTNQFEKILRVAEKNKEYKQLPLTLKELSFVDKRYIPPIETGLYKFFIYQWMDYNLTILDPKSKKLYIHLVVG